MKSTVLQLTVLSVAIITMASLVSAGPTDYDTSFHGGSGYLLLGTSDHDEWPTDVVTAADGTVFVAAIVETSNGATGRRPAVMKVNPDGDPDFNFGAAGIYEIPVDMPGNVIGSFVDLGLTADGGIVVSMPGEGGSPSSLNFFVAKVKADGSGLDLSFGLFGLTGVAFDYLAEGGGDDWPMDLVVQPDGAIVVVGYAQATSEASGDEDFAIARFTPTGGVDDTFNADGKVRAFWDIGGSKKDDAFGVALTSTGEIIVVGMAETSLGSDLAVLALDHLGAKVTDFDNDGMATYQYTPFGGPASAYTAGYSVTTALPSIKNDPLEKAGIYDTIYITGTTVDPTVLNATEDIAILCIGGGGGLCGSFGVQGWTTFDLSDNSFGGIGDTEDLGLQIMLDSSDSTLTVIAEASQTGGSNSYAAVARVLTSDGSWDTSFGSNGSFYFSIPSGDLMNVAGTMDPQDRILFTTDSYNVSNDVRLNRLLGSGYIFNDGFEGGDTSHWSSVQP